MRRIKMINKDELDEIVYNIQINFLRLRRSEGYSYSKIADILGIDEKSAKDFLDHGRMINGGRLYSADRERMNMLYNPDYVKDEEK
jgi:hypothetical protein